MVTTIFSEMTHQPLMLNHIPVGSHLCQIFDTDEDRNALVELFIRQGIERGELVLYLVERSEDENLIFHLLGKDLKTERHLASGQIRMQSVESMKNQQGVYDPDSMFDFLIPLAETTLQGGFSGLRIVGEMGWMLTELSAERFIPVENRLVEIFEKYHVTGLSQYNRQEVGAKVLMDIVITHPIVVIGQELFQNFYYVPPTELLGGHPAEEHLTEWINNLFDFKRASEQLHITRFWVESASDAIFWIGIDGGFQYVNKTACQLLEYSYTEFMSMKVAEIDSSVSTEVWRSRWKTLKESGSVVFESFHRNKSGRLIPVEVKSNYLQYAGMEYVCAIARDITERKRAEEMLQKSEEKYRLVADFTFDWEYWVDPTGKYVYISPSCQRVTGYTAEEFIAHPDLLQKITQPVDRQKIREHEKQNRKKARHVCQMDFRIRAKDGQERWVSHYCQPVYNQNGDWLGQRGSNRDITDRKRAEDAQHKTEEQFRLLVEGVQDYAIYNLDPDGRVTSWNAGVERMSGFSAKDVLGHDIAAFYPSIDVARKKPQYDLMMAVKKGTFENEGWRVRKDGSRFWVHAVTTALRDEEGNLTGFARIIRDITGRKLEHEKHKAVKPSPLSDY